MTGWLRRNAEAIEALAGVATALITAVALIGVKIQIDEAERVQALQSARAAYLAQQSLSAQYPKFAQPADACALMASNEANAYEAYVTHLLFTAEQMLDVSEGWEPTFLYEFLPHKAYLCQNARSLNTTLELRNLLDTFEEQSCAEVPRCPSGEG